MDGLGRPKKVAPVGRVGRVGGYTELLAKLGR